MRRPLVAAAVLALSTAGCLLGGARLDRSTFFTLTTTVPTEAATAGSWDVTIGLGPVAIPSYLDRPQLVTRVGPNEVRLAPLARWAEPLREGFVRVLQQDLLIASGARQVVLHPWPVSTRMDLVVTIDVLRFEADTSGNAEIVARWTARRNADARVLASRESRTAERADGIGRAADVAALSRALGALAQEIATTLRTASG
jgi:uncharacterized protein